MLMAKEHIIHADKKTNREMISIGVLTVSDRCSRGEAEDKSGANLQELVNSANLIKGQVSQMLPNMVLYH